MNVLLDTNAIIYLVEKTPIWGEKVQTMLRQISAQTLWISAISRLECRVKPLREKDASALERWDHFFTLMRDTTVPLDSAVLDKAAELRALYRYRTPDAIVLASAHVARCDMVISSDHALRNSAGLDVRILE